MAGKGDPSEDVPEVTLVNAAEVASSWRGVGTALDGIGHQYAALKATGVSFPEKVTSAMFGIGQGCTSLGAQWTTAAGDVQTQHDAVDTPKAADYKTKTAEVRQAKEATAQGIMIAALGGSPSYAESAAANLATKRAARQQVLDSAVSETATRIQPLPGHAKLAGEAVTTARSTMVTQSGGQPMPADVQQIVPPTSGSPSGNPSGGPNTPASNTPSSPNKPSTTEPTDEKKGGDDQGKGGDPSSAKPWGQQQQSPQQGGQPQSGQGQQPQGGAPVGGQPSAQQRGAGAVPISAPTPFRSDPSKVGPTVRPTTPPAPPSTPAQRAGVDGRTSPLGSGTTATGAGTGSPTANKSGGGIGAGSGSGSGSGTSGAGTRPMMGGMMGGAGHGAGGGQGGTARPKGEVRADPSDKKMRGEDVAEQALGGIVKDGDTGAPIPPAAPGNNGGAPVLPSPPSKP